jgi:hypothetical protein
MHCEDVLEKGYKNATAEFFHQGNLRVPPHACLHQKYNVSKDYLDLSIKALASLASTGRELR